MITRQQGATGPSYVGHWLWLHGHVRLLRRASDRAEAIATIRAALDAGAARRRAGWDRDEGGQNSRDSRFRRGPERREPSNRSGAIIGLLFAPNRQRSGFPHLTMEALDAATV